jgi:purine-binding chemotaxis protein CheW
LELEPDQIEPAPRIGTQLKTEFIKGMGKRDDRFIILLDIDKVFSSEELAVIAEMEGEESLKKAGNE